MKAGFPILTRIYSLIGYFVARNHLGYSLEHDTNIEPKVPMLYIPNIGLYPTGHFRELFRFSPKAVDLSPTGNTGLDKMTHLVTVDETSILFIVLEHVRTRTDQTHIALEYIDKLRQLIEIGPT